MEITLKRRINTKKKTIEGIVVIKKSCKTKYNLTKNNGKGGKPINTNINHANWKRYSFISLNHLVYAITSNKTNE